MSPVRKSPPVQKARALYEDVADRLMNDIKAGHYIVGGLLPTEHELSTTFSVSRQTVRAALNILKDRGYITRKKAVGSRIESASPTTAYTQAFDTIEDLVRTAAAEVRSIKTIRHVSMNRTVARRLGGPLGSRWIQFSGPRIDVRRGGAPVSWGEIYVDTNLEKITQPALDNPGTLISALIESECGREIVEIRQMISATEISEKIAEALKVPVGSSALSIIRHYKEKSGQILEISETTYPAGRVTISSQLKRGSRSGRATA